jgi:uncharacterized protein
MGRPALLVNATELLRQPGQQRHIDVAVPMDAIDVVDDRLSGDIAVDVVLTSSIDDIEVAGRLSVAWSDTCRRCLRPLDEVLVVDVDERYAPVDDTGMRRVDPEAFPIEHGQLDLAPMVREEVLLGVPDAPLCRPDCPGLCPTCGADLQTGSCDCTPEDRDERWAVLDQLRLEE